MSTPTTDTEDSAQALAASVPKASAPPAEAPAPETPAPETPVKDAPAEDSPAAEAPVDEAAPAAVAQAAVAQAAVAQAATAPAKDAPADEPAAKTPARDETPVTGRRLRDRDRLARRINFTAVALITIGFATLYSVYSLVKHAHYQTGLLDLGIFDQTIRSYAHFHLPHSPIVGMDSPTDLGRLQWSDHFTPILAILAPLYWIYDNPKTLLVAQGALFAAAIPALWLFTRRSLGLIPAYGVAIAYGLSWTIQDSLLFPFHEVAFAVPIMAWMLERFQAEKYRQAALVSLLLLTVKEDLGFVIGVFGAYMIFRGARKWGLGLLIGGPLGTLIITQVIIPLSGGSPKRNWSYDQFGHSPGVVAKYMAHNPIGVAEYALTPGVKIHTLLWLLAPLFFIALRSPIILLAAPLIAERFLSNNELYWGVGYHYNAFVIAILFCASVDGIRRLMLVPPRFKPLLASAWGIAIVLAAVAALPKWMMYQEMRADAFWHPHTAEVSKVERAMAQIPSGVLVAAPNVPGGHLTNRDKVILWSWFGDRGFTFEAPWILADVQRPTFPFASLDAQRRRVDELKGKGYQVVYDRDGYIVLHHP
jgi:uncharacterized membrane protein